MIKCQQSYESSKHSARYCLLKFLPFHASISARIRMRQSLCTIPYSVIKTVFKPAEEIRHLSACRWRDGWAHKFQPTRLSIGGYVKW